MAKGKLDDEQRIAEFKRKLDERKNAPMISKKSSTLWDVILPPDFTKSKEIIKDVMTIKKIAKLDEVFEDTLREIEEKNPSKNYDCSIGFMFISMLHVANEEDGNLKF
jgi:hypothetical protein